MTISLILAAAGGGAIGSGARYLACEASQRWLGNKFPWGTLAVNMLGCFLIGLLYGVWADGDITAEMQALCIAGMCGGLTTFSSFALEAMTMWMKREWVKSATYILGTVTVCLLTVYLGKLIAN